MLDDVADIRRTAKSPFRFPPETQGPNPIPYNPGSFLLSNLEVMHIKFFTGQTQHGKELTSWLVHNCKVKRIIVQFCNKAKRNEF